MNVKRRAFPLEIKAKPDSAGRFTAYVSIFGTPDSYREVVAPGAFDASLAATAAAGRRLPILWQHNMSEPIGVWDSLTPDATGLLGVGDLWLDVSPYARIAQRGMAAGCITGASIGFYPVAHGFNEETRIRTLTEIDLREASIVTDPAHSDARVDVVKAKLAAGDMPTERDFDKLLRERGFSRSDADAIASVGFKAWAAGAPRSHQAARNLGDLAKALGSFTLTEKV